MANYCYTDYKFVGEKEVIEKFWNKLQELDIEKYNCQLSSVAKHFGVDYEKEHISVRGQIVFAENQSDDNEYMVHITTETAWVGCHDLFHSINKLFDNELAISYVEVESGCGVYNIHNEIYVFDSECYVDCDGEFFHEASLEPFFDKAEDAIIYWLEKMGQTWDKEEKNEKEMVKYINNYKYDDDETYFYIDYFTFI